MVLNFIWIAFFLIAFVVSAFKLIILGDTQLFPNIMNHLFDMAKSGFDIALGLTGMLTFWLGIMKIGEKAGVIEILARFIGPFFNRLFPEIPKNHPVIGQLMMNFSANMLGLDNAATPLGLKAMQGLQDLNPDKSTASNAQIMFLVLNASGLTIIPISIMNIRAQMGALNPSDIFIPLLLATFCSTIVGMIAVGIYQKINFFDKIILAYLSIALVCIGGAVYYFNTLPHQKIGEVSTLISNMVMFALIAGFILLAAIKKMNVFETFIEGAKEGFEVATKIIPYLIAMLVAIAVFRACGAMDYIMLGMEKTMLWLGIGTEFIPALPTALMKPLSGGGARAMMIETMKTHGADSFAGRLSCVFQGSADTTFFIIALYFGSVGIKHSRYAVTCSLLADLAGVIAAIMVAYLFFQ
jgi:spore maturation protein SpmA